MKLCSWERLLLLGPLFPVLRLKVTTLRKPSLVLASWQSSPLFWLLLVQHPWVPGRQSPKCDFSLHMQGLALDKFLQITTQVHSCSAMHTHGSTHEHGQESRYHTWRCPCGHRCYQACATVPTFTSISLLCTASPSHVHAPFQFPFTPVYRQQSEAERAMLPVEKPPVESLVGTCFVWACPQPRLCTWALPRSPLSAYWPWLHVGHQKASVWPWEMLTELVTCWKGSAAGVSEGERMGVGVSEENLIKTMSQKRE